jgi:hypothetical protein
MSAVARAIGAVQAASAEAGHALVPVGTRHPFFALLGIKGSPAPRAPAEPRGPIHLAPRPRAISWMIVAPREERAAEAGDS